MALLSLSAAIWCADVPKTQLGQNVDWNAFAGDAQRDGWDKTEAAFTKDDVAHFQLLWRRGMAAAGKEILLPPVIVGNQALVAGSGNDLWSIDADANRVAWGKHLASKKAKLEKMKKACSGGLTAMPATLATSHPVYFLTGDGMLHQLNQQDGAETGNPLKFLPKHASVGPLNVTGNAIYTSTSGGCSGVANAVWVMDMSGVTPKVRSFNLGNTAVTDLGGVVLGSDGTVFARTGEGTFDLANGKLANCLLALSPLDLTLRQYFIFPTAASKRNGDLPAPATPVAFQYKNQDLVVAAGGDGRLYVLDAAVMGGDNHDQFLSRSTPLGDVRGGLSSWQDPDGTRYVLAPVWGPLNEKFKAPVISGDVSRGAIVAFRLTQEENLRPVLVPVWMTGSIPSPAPPVIAQGVVFALANGVFNRKGPVKGTHATLYALDGETGKQIYSTGDQINMAANAKGLSMANGRLYFLTVDNTLNVFGKFQEPELTQKAARQ
jgi:outer membrane protein assembly factor BamB